MYAKYVGHGFLTYTFENQEFDQGSLDKLFLEENIYYSKGSAFPIKIIKADNNLYYQIGSQDDGQLFFEDDSDAMVHDCRVADFVISLLSAKRCANLLTIQ